MSYKSKLRMINMTFFSKLAFSLLVTAPLSGLAAVECQTARTQFIDNDAVKVWETLICPNQAVSKHTHAHPRVLIPKEKGTLRVTYTEKPRGINNPVDLKLEKGKPIYLDYEQGKEPHIDEILGDRPISVFVVELKGVKHQAEQ